MRREVHLVHAEAQQLGCISAASRLHLGRASRLHLGHISGFRLHFAGLRLISFKPRLSSSAALLSMPSSSFIIATDFAAENANVAAAFVR